jgi:hypothetical protein
MGPKGIGPNGLGAPKAMAKQTKKPKYTDKLYEKSQRLTEKAEKAASEGKTKKAVRLENRAARVEKRDKKRTNYTD